MTYKDVIDRFQQVANQHYMIKDFGYGQLSDIKVHSEDGEADYPYLFLNPTTHTRTGTVMTYEFNMIMMDIAIDEGDPFGNWINIQSQCQQYIDDVFAQLYYGYTDQPLIDYSNVTYTPFKERFQDSLAGMTAAISIEVPTPINQCIAPIQPLVPPPPVGTFVLDASSTAVHNFNPDVLDNPQPFPNVILDTYNAMRPVVANFYNITQNGTWSFVMTGTAVRLTDTSNFPTGFNLNTQSGGVSLEADVSNWPTNPAVGVNFDFELKWTDIPLQISNGYVAFQTKDEPPTEDSGQTFIGTNIKGYYTPTV